MMSLDRPQGLYAIVDADALRDSGMPLAGVIEAVAAAKPAFLQLRAKSATPRQILVWLRDSRAACRRAGVPLILNDRPDLAVLADCDGVHVGQNDVSVTEVRRFAKSLLVGVSTHDDEQLSAALDEKPDYVAFGPVFPTTSKVDPDPVVGLDGLRRAASRCAPLSIPLVAIGGIDLERAPQVAATGALGAVIGALGVGLRSIDEVYERACRLHAALTQPEAGRT